MYSLFDNEAQIDLISQQMKDGMFQMNLKRLLGDAEHCMEITRISVVDNPLVPPSGNVHDYYSIAPYYWPNPDTDDGLPYVKRDGEFNPEFEKCDRRRMDAICATVRTLTLAYAVARDENYRQHAVKLVRGFFLDGETCMNPHLEFAQAVRGRMTGCGYGIIDIRYLYRMLDMLTILDDRELNKSIAAWMGKLQTWLLLSDKGREEAEHENNHGTWYDVTNASIALFCGNRALAKDILAKFETKRMLRQVAEDGSMPIELRRTRSFLYSTLNLYGYFMAAKLGEKADVDLWQSSAMRRAFEFMLPYYESYDKWTYTQIADNWEQTWEQAYEILCLAAVKYAEPAYKRIAEQMRMKHIQDSDVIFFGC